MSLESDGGMILTGENRTTRRETCPSASLSTTNPTWIDPVANPGLRGKRPATNDLSHGTALWPCYMQTDGNGFSKALKAGISHVVNNYVRTKASSCPRNYSQTHLRPLTSKCR
jgi:hypothetical protein